MVEHHAAHAASAYYPSPFDEATVLTLDRDGDFRSAARWHASGNQLHLEKDLYYPDSLGDLYSRVTELLGFSAGSDEHKVQWLSTADSGEQFLPLFEELLGSSDWPCINRSFFDSDRLSQGGFSEKFYSRLGLEDGAEIPEELRAPLAAGLQHAIENVVLRMAGPAENLCVAGGLGMNALLISALEESKQVYVQPAAGNAGTALGAVFYAWNNVFGQKKRASVERSLPGAELCRRRSEEGAGKLQIAVPLSDDDGGVAGSRCSRFERREDHRMDARAAWSLGRARSATAASWLRR